MELKIFKSLRLICYAIALVAVVYFGKAWIQGYTMGLPWQVETTFESQALLLNYFDIDGQASGIYVDQLLALQRYYTEDIAFHLTAQQLLFWLFVLSMVFITAFISLLDRTNYLIAAGLICLMLTQLQIEELGFLEDYIGFIIIALFVIISYYFKSFRPQTHWGIRLITSALAYGALVLSFALFSPAIDQPIVAISQGIFGPIVLSILFVLFVSGENIFSLFKLATTAQPGKKGLVHFSVIGIIYLAICWLLFKEKNEGLGFSLYIISPEFLMLFSAFSAYLSFEVRQHELENGIAVILKSLLYPIGAAVFFYTYAFAVLSVNDSIKNALDWVIIIAHLTMGLAYFLYALVNFIPALLQGISIWPAFYKGPKTAILTIRLMGFVLFMGGFFYLEYRPYYDAKAGQLNMLGDLAKYFNRPDVAKSYFDQAIFNDFYSIKANYSINQLAEKEYAKAEARTRLENVFNKNGDPITRIALANEFTEEERLYRALTTLQSAEAAELTQELQTNLGLAHYYYKNYDSAYNYFSAAGAKTNLEAVKYLLNDRIDIADEAPSAMIEKRINQQAIANLNDKYLPFTFQLNKDTLINRADIFYLYNAALSRQEWDRKELISTLDSYINNPKNVFFESFLLTAKALAHYHSGEVNQAFNTIDLVINRTPGTSGFETFLKGVWYYDQGQPELTVEYVNLAQKRSFQAEQVETFVEAVQNIKNYRQKADISIELDWAQKSFDATQATEPLEAVAQLNAFDHASTLTAIDLLLQNSFDNKALYDIILEATQINPKSPELLEAYIYQCERVNLTKFANTALESLSGMVAYEKYFEVAKKLNVMRADKGHFN